MEKTVKNLFLLLCLGLLSSLYLACEKGTNPKNEKEDLDPDKTTTQLEDVLDSADQFIIDTDNDGIADLSDNDIDGDGIPNTQDSDMDGDGKRNEDDLDMDGDGYLNVVDADMDGDGILNSLDSDLDGDGIENDVDPDIDGDGIANDADNDMDGDGIVNSADNTIGGENTIINGIVIKPGDLDGDGIDNQIDPDIDGDGISNKEDDDIDGDGYPNGEDFNFGFGKDLITNSNNTDNKNDTGNVVPDKPITDTTGGSSSIEDGSQDRIKRLGKDQCYWGDNGSGQEVPLVKIIHAVSDDLVDIVVIFSPDFVDNSWGENVVGTSSYKVKNRPFSSVHKSDHVILNLRDANQKIVMDVKLDLLSQINDSTWITLGPNGEDGYIGGPNNVGELEDILSFGTTTHDNLNEYGYDVVGNELHINSPATDSLYTPNPDFPEWEFRVAYRMTVTKDLFGDAGYGDVLMTSVHASPAKTASSTIEVDDGSCEDTGDLFILKDVTQKTFEITEWTE